MAAGTRRGDIVHNAYGYGLFTGGLGVHYGAEKLGASVIPISGGNTKRQVMIMKDFGPTVLTCTPSYALHVAEVAEEMGVDFRDLKFKASASSAPSPGPRLMRQKIERKLNLKAMDVYGLSEMMGPGVAIECYRGQGRPAHLRRPLHPRDHQPQDRRGAARWDPPASSVITTITKEAFPLIRYRTRDISVLYPEPCRCGRTHRAHGPDQGRSDDMLIIRGVNVFPSQIESVIMETKDFEPHYQLVVERMGTLDQLTVLVEVNEAMFSDEIKNLQSIERELEKNIKRNAGRGLPGQAGGAQGHPAQRRQGRAGDRQAKNLRGGGHARRADFDIPGKQGRPPVGGDPHL